MPPASWQQRLHDNVARVRDEIAAACRRRDRDPATVHLVGVTKYVATEVLHALVAAGVTDIGESRAQQLTRRAAATGARLDWPEGPAAADESAPRYHMIGHLQRNKVNQLLPHARIIHSLDSARLAQALDRRAAELDAAVDVFIEVNVAGEQSKSGLAPDELAGLAAATVACPHLRLRGLMTMAPYDPDPETARPCFVRLRSLRDELLAAGTLPATCHHLSMGMSQDYAVAVEEGATFVRIGSALFAGLPTSDPREES